MISIKDFQILPFKKKCDFITVFADYLIHRKEAEDKHYLYYMNDYFVEVVYSPDDNRVLGINAFKSLDRLEPYLELISIGELSVL